MPCVSYQLNDISEGVIQIQDPKLRGKCLYIPAGELEVREQERDGRGKSGGRKKEIDWTSNYGECV